MKRKVLSILLSMLMIFSTQVTALASEETLISSIDAIILQKAERLLQIAATDPTAFGVSGVNYGTLSLGNGIPTYEYINGDYIQTDVYYYPVYSNNSIFAVILAEVKSEDDISVGFTTETAPELNAFLNAHSSSAILLDRNGAYAFSGGDLLEIAENQFPVTERSVIGNVQPHTANSDIAVSQIAEVSRGQIAPLLARNRSQISLFSELPPGNPSHSGVEVNFYNQAEDTEYCWACATACVGNYETGSTAYTGESLALNYCGALDEPQSVDIIPYLLDYYYGVDTYERYAESPTYDIVKTALNAQHPIIVRAQYTGGGGHYIVGFHWYEYDNLGEKYIAYMDSLRTDAYIGDVSQYGVLSYISPGSATVATMTHYVKYVG